MRAALILLLLLTAFSAPGPRNRDREHLDREIAERTAGPPQDCVDARSTMSMRPVDVQTMRLDDGRTLYVNTLTSECPGLEPTDTLIVETHGSQYCRGDHIRSVPFGGGIPGRICVLGRFTPYRKPG